MINQDFPVLFIFIVVYFTVPVAIMSFLHKIEIDLRKVSLLSMFLIYYFALSFIGHLPLFFGWFEYPMEIGVVDSYRILVMLLYNSINIFLVIFGFYLVQRIAGPLTESTDIPSKLTFRSITFLNIIVVLCLIIFILYQKHTPQLPFMAILFEGTDLVKVLRSQATNDFQGPLPYHYYRLFYSTILIFAVLTFYAQVRLTGKTVHRLTFILSFIFAAFTAIMNTEKAPIIWLIIGCLLIHFHLDNKRISFRSIFLLSLPIIGLMVLMVAIFMVGLDRGFFYYLESVFRRIFVGGMIPGYFYLELFPDMQDFLLGKSFPNPRGIFPWEPYPLTLEVKTFMNPELIKAGIVGSAPTAYWGELYANFGLLGLLVISPLIGIGLYVLQGLLNMLPNSPVKSALVVWCALHYMKLAETSFSNYLFDEDIVAIMMIAIIMMAADNHGKIKLRITPSLTSIKP